VAVGQARRAYVRWASTPPSPEEPGNQHNTLPSRFPGASSVQATAQQRPPYPLELLEFRRGRYYICLRTPYKQKTTGR
jgi:hypothetical protein